jgi:hypothetical protein
MSMQTRMVTGKEAIARCRSPVISNMMYFPAGPAKPDTEPRCSLTMLPITEWAIAFQGSIGR